MYTKMYLILKNNGYYYLIWTLKSPDNIVDLQADDFHDKSAGLQNARLGTSYIFIILHVYWLLSTHGNSVTKQHSKIPLWCLKVGWGFQKEVSSNSPKTSLFGLKKRKEKKQNTIQHVNHVVFHLHMLFQLKVRLRTFTYFVRKTEMALSLRSCQRARRKARPARCSSGGHQYLPCCLESIRSNTTWRQLHSPSRNSYKFKTRMSLMKLQQWEK